VNGEGGGARAKGTEIKGGRGRRGVERETGRNGGPFSYVRGPQGCNKTLVNKFGEELWIWVGENIGHRRKKRGEKANGKGKDRKKYLRREKEVSGRVQQGVGGGGLGGDSGTEGGGGKGWPGTR